MAKAPQGTFEFTGVKQILGGTFTLSHGVSPSICTIDTIGRIKNTTGTLTIKFGNTKFTFKDCLVDSQTDKHTPNGIINQIVILDRRWKLREGTISGRFNSKGFVNKANEFGFEFSLSHLVFALLVNLGINNITDKKAVANIKGIPIDWSDANPANELATLLNTFGYRFILTADDKFKIISVGKGEPLPKSPMLESSDGIDFQAKYDGIQVICQPSEYQSGFLLDAVGMEFGPRGQEEGWQRIDDLSYRPGGGGKRKQQKINNKKRKGKSAWKKQIPTYMQDIDINHQDYAQKNIYKHYRINNIKDNGAHGYIIPVERADNLLPLKNYRWFPTGGGKFIKIATRLDGIFYSRQHDFENVKNPTRLDDVVSVSENNGIVTLGQLTYKLKNNGTATEWDAEFAEAELMYQAAHNYREELLHGLVRFSAVAKLNDDGGLGNIEYHNEITSNNSTENYLKVKSDLFLIEVAGYDEKNGLKMAEVVSSERLLKKQLKDVLQNTAKSLREQQTKTVKYDRLLNENLDGIRQQISWKVGSHGVNGIATTEIGLNREFDLAVPPAKRRRRLEIEAAE